MTLGRSGLRANDRSLAPVRGSTMAPSSRVHYSPQLMILGRSGLRANDLMIANTKVRDTNEIIHNLGSVRCGGLGVFINRVLCISISSESAEQCWQPYCTGNKPVVAYVTNNSFRGSSSRPTSLDTRDAVRFFFGFAFLFSQNQGTEFYRCSCLSSLFLVYVCSTEEFFLPCA